MRTIFVIGILLVCAFMAGWFTVQRDDEGTTIRFNRDEIHGDTRQAIDRGREFLDRNNSQTSNEQIARQPDQPYVANAPAGYDPQGYQQPSTDPRYQNQQYQNQQYQDPRYQNQAYPPRNY